METAKSTERRSLVQSRACWNPSALFLARAPGGAEGTGTHRLTRTCAHTHFPLPRLCTHHTCVHTLTHVCEPLGTYRQSHTHAHPEHGAGGLMVAPGPPEPSPVMNANALRGMWATPGAVLSLCKAGFSAPVARVWSKLCLTVRNYCQLESRARKAPESWSTWQSCAGESQYVPVLESPRSPANHPSQGREDTRAHTDLFLAPPQLLRLLPAPSAPAPPQGGLVMKGVGGGFARERSPWSPPCPTPAPSMCQDMGHPSSLSPPGTGTASR